MTEKINKKHHLKQVFIFIKRPFIVSIISSIIAGLIVFGITYSCANKTINDLKKNVKSLNGTIQLSGDKIQSLENIVQSLKDTILVKESLIETYKIEIVKYQQSHSGSGDNKMYFKSAKK